MRPISMSPTSNLQHELKRHDTGLGLSESPPTSSTTPQQQQDGMTRIRRTTSTSTQSSTKSNDSSSSTRSRFHEGLLMPNATPDLQHEARHASYRRRVRREVFGNDNHFVHIDWKSTPVVFDERYDYASLLYRRELRTCDASYQYLLEIRDELRRKAARDVVRESSDGIAQVVCIDGEEMIDMVG